MERTIPNAGNRESGGTNKLTWVFAHGRQLWRVFAGLSLLLGPPTAGAVTATLSVPTIDYDGTFTVSWNVDPGPNQGGYTLLYQDGVVLVQKGFGSQSHQVTVGSGTHSYRVHYAYMPENPCGGPGCNPQLIHGDTDTKTTEVWLTPPASPPTIEAQPTTDNNGSYTVSWSASTGAQNYQWQERKNSGSWSSPTTTSGTSLSRSGKTSATWRYQVRACNPNGCTAYSAVKSVIVALTPGVPSSISADPDPSPADVTVSWGAASGSVTKYDFDYKKSTAGSWTPGYDGTSLSKELPGLAEGIWNYRVRACKTQSTYTSCSGWRTGNSTVYDVPEFSVTSPANNVTGSYTVTWTPMTETTLELQERVDGGTWGTIYTGEDGQFPVSGRGNGTYQYRIFLANGYGNFYSNVSTTDVDVPSPPTIQTGVVAGNTPYQTGVTKGGNGYITVPVSVVPGINGLHPHLSIAYNSGRERQRIDETLPGDTLGYGFSVTGIPSIRKCVKGEPNGTPVSWQPYPHIKLCLNGEPLVLVSGTDYWATDAEYRTMRENYHRVLRRGTDWQDFWLEVHAPDGTVMEFGHTDNSRINALYIQVHNTPQGPVQTVDTTLPYFWSINRQVDAFGNEINYTYFKDEYAGVNHVSSISYGDNGDTVVKFSYSGRTDVTETPFDNVTLRQNLVLHTISTWLDDVQVRRYTLSSEYAPAPYYWRRLDQLQVCAYDEYGGNSQCLAPLDFTWAEPIDAAPDLKTFVTSVTDSLGATTAFDYDLITESDPHSFLFSERPFGNAVVPPDTQPIEPLPNEDGLKYVVTKITRDNGVNGSHETSYAYHGRGLDSTKSWGFLGFYGTRITDETSGIVTYHQYRLDFPHFAETAQTRQYDATFGAHTLELTRSETAFATRTVPYSLGSTVLPYAAVTTSYIKEGTAELGISQVINDLDPLDSNGFIPGMTRTARVADSYSTGSGGSFWGAVPNYTPTTVLRTIESDQIFENDTSGGNWLIGFTDWAETRHYRGAPSSAPLDQTQSVDYTRFGTTNAVLSEERFPGDPVYSLTMTYGYDGYGNVDSQTVVGVNVASRTSGTSPGADPRYPSAVTNPLSHQSQVVFDQRFGSMKSATDPNGRTTHVYYDNFGREISRTTPDLVTVTTEYQRCGIEVTCSAVTNAQFGSVTPAMRVQTSSPVSPTKRVYLDVLGRAVRTEIESFDGTYVRQDTEYDARGRVKRSSTPYLIGQSAHYATVSYDIRDRVTGTTSPDGGETTTTYTGASGQIDVVTTASVKNAQGVLVDTQVKRSVFSLLGDLVSTTDDEGGEDVDTTYEYYATGLPLSVTINDGGTPFSSLFVFDDAGNRTSMTDPDIGTVVSHYTALGELRQTIKNGVLTTDYDYDLLGRLETKNDPDGLATWTYDPANATGAIESRSYGNGFSETFVYNTDARPSSVTTQINAGGLSRSYAHSYLYDTQGRIDKVTYPTGIQVRYDYNSRGYLRALIDQASSVELMTFEAMDAYGNITEQAFANGIDTSRSYDPKSGRLLGIDSILSGGAVIQDNAYEWRTNGILESRLQSLGGTSRQEVFGHDGLNRLETSETFVNSVLTRTLDTDFDARGNLLQKTSSVSGDTDVSNYLPSSGRNQLDSAVIDGTSHSFGYDLHGQIVTYDRLAAGDDKFIDWNGRGLPERITVGASSADPAPTARDEFEYGPAGQRYYKRSTWDDSGAQKIEHTFYVRGFEELVTDPTDTTLNAVQKAHIGDSIVHIKSIPDVGAPTTRLEYLHKDHLGSVEAVTDESGAVVRRMGFDPYGQRRKDDWLRNLNPAETEDLADDLRESTTRGFTSHEQLDRTGFIHMNGRVYDPVLGRFLSPDPFVQSPSYSQSWNRYSYVMNNPMSYTDPTGFVREGSMCGSGLILCMNGAAPSVGGSGSSFSISMTVQTISTSSGSYFSVWIPTGQQFVPSGTVDLNVPLDLNVPPSHDSDTRTITLGTYVETGFNLTSYSGGASVSNESVNINVNTKEASEPDEPIDSAGDSRDVKISFTSQDEGAGRIVEAAQQYDVEGLMQDVLPGGTYDIRLRLVSSADLVDPDGTQAFMRLVTSEDILVAEDLLPNKSANILAGAIGHELIHLDDMVRGNLNFFDEQSVYRSEVRAYFWQLENRKHFDYGAGTRIWLMNQIQKFNYLLE